MDEDVRKLLERGVTALEKLSEDDVITVETKPAVCPHCEKMNPNVRVQESEASGLLGEFLIQAHCLNCNNVFYAFPEMWSTMKTVGEAESIVEERAAQHGYNGREN
jgi:hypothetical protein